MEYKMTISSSVHKLYKEKSAGGRASKWWKNNNAWLSHVREGKRWYGIDKVIYLKYYKHLKEAAQKMHLGKWKLVSFRQISLHIK